MLKTAAGNAVSAAEESKRRNIRYHSLTALYQKEMADHVTSKRFIIILILVIAMTIASVYGAVTGISSAIKNAAMDSKSSFDMNYMFLKLYTTSGSSIPSYMSLIALVGPFIGLILGFDSINAEKNNGTLNRLVSQPIYRDSIIIGKFLASSTLIAIMVLMNVFVHTTRIGKAMRAVPQDKEAATIVGIDVDRIITLTFALGCALAAVAALMYVSTYPRCTTDMGSMMGIKAFIAAVLGGIGIIPGAMLGGIIVGLIEIFVKIYLAPGWYEAITYGILIVVLLIKPSGILGKNTGVKV